jgi:hypothetical protein
VNSALECELSKPPRDAKHILKIGEIAFACRCQAGTIGLPLIVSLKL